jgi:hypothetical protein
VNNELHYLLVVSFAEATQRSAVLGIVSVEAQPIEQTLDQQTRRCIIELQIVIHPLQHLILGQRDVSANMSVAHCRRAVEWLLLLLIVPAPPSTVGASSTVNASSTIGASSTVGVDLLLLIEPARPSAFAVAFLPSQPSLTLSRLHCAMP